MRPAGEEEGVIAREIIGKAIAIHRVLGPGLLESVYEYFLAQELRKAGLHVQQQKPIPWRTMAKSSTWAFART